MAPFIKKEYYRLSFQVPFCFVGREMHLPSLEVAFSLISFLYFLGSGELSPSGHHVVTVVPSTEGNEGGVEG